MDGQEVWVAAGSYYGAITLKRGVTLKGGFSGSGTLRDTVAYPSMIDASNSDDEAAAVTAVDGATIDGFGITGSCTYAIQCAATSPTITDNTIDGTFYCGVRCTGGSPIVQRNTFTTTDQYNFGIYASGGAPTIAANVFTGQYFDSIAGELNCPACCHQQPGVWSMDGDRFPGVDSNHCQ